MNPTILAFFLMAVWASCGAQITILETNVTESSASSGGSSKSVTTTSDGKTTVKTTVTIVDGVKKVVTETTDENGKVTRKESGDPSSKKIPGTWIGLRVGEVPKILRDQLDLAENEGLVVELVAENSPSSRAGIRIGDLLLTLGEKSVATSKQLSEELLNRKVGEKTKATIMRKAKRIDLKIELEEAPKREGVKVPKNLLEGFGQNSIKSVDLDVSGAGIDAILDNPDLPESFKKSIRAMQKTLQEFEKKSE